MMLQVEGTPCCLRKLVSLPPGWRGSCYGIRKQCKPLLQSRVVPHSHYNGSDGSAEDIGSTTTSNSSLDGASPRFSAAMLPISQQSLNMAFHLLDKDEDGLISRTEAYRMVAFYLALQQYKPPEAAARPLTWDQHLLVSISTARRLTGGSMTALGATLEAFVAAKMSGGLQKHPPQCSDLVWAGAGMAVAFLTLGLLAAAAKSLPVVGQWHHHGAPLLLGSFGTIAILLFGKPEADAVRLWPIIAGQLGATVIAISIIQLFGASVVSRACAMAATVTYMMWTDSIHPPGGALVLMSMDNAAIQQMQWGFMLWPSLLLCLGVLLPVSAATNWLRRNRQFDWPGSSNPAVTLEQKQREYQEQQRKKADMLQRHAAMMLSDRILKPQAAAQLSAGLKGTVFRLSGLAKAVLQYQQKQKLEQQWKQQQKPEPDQQAPAEASSDASNAGRFASPAAAALDAILRRRLNREADRKLEDELHRKHLWGAAAPNFKHYEVKLQKLHEQRIRQQQQQQQQQQPSSDLLQSINQQQQAGQQHCSSDKQPIADSSVSSNSDAMGRNKLACGKSDGFFIRSSSPVGGARDSMQQQQQPQHLYSWERQQQRPAWMYRWRSDIATVPGVGDFGYVGPLDSFAPDEHDNSRQQDTA